MIKRIVLGIFFSVMTLLSGLLFIEYLSMRTQVSRLYELQEEYQNYSSSLRRVLRDYQRLKEADKESETDSSANDDEKKKERPFITVNREPSHLHKGAVRYLKEQRMDRLIASLQTEDVVEPIYPRRRQWRRRHRVARLQRHVPRADHRGPLVARQLARYHMIMKRKTEAADMALSWPINRSHFWLSSFFGMRRKPDRSWQFHHGIDLAAIKGTPVNAAASGVIIEAGPNRGYGNTIVIMHNNKYKTRYAHLQRIKVRVGQQVATGDLIGTVGDTGLVRSRGKFASHLHLEVYRYDKRVNPIYFFHQG